MTQGKRFGLSSARKIDMWCRWKAGGSLHKIGRAFGKEDSFVGWRCVTVGLFGKHRNSTR